MIRVACAQVAPVIGDVDHNRALAQEAITRAAAAGAELVVLPELCSSGYVFHDRAEARSLAEPLHGPTVTGWRELAAHHGLVIVGGFCERVDDEILGNSAVLIDRGELLSLYRKTHLWDREPDCFAPGAAAPEVVPTSLGAVGVVVCYDTFFPEVLRALALAGAELIAAPMNNPVIGPLLEPHAAEVVTTQAAAISNRVFIAQCDRAGEERGVSWVGASAIIDPDGRLLGGEPAAGERMVIADVDLAAAGDKRVSARNDVLADRRPDLYGELVSPPPVPR